MRARQARLSAVCALLALLAGANALADEVSVLAGGSAVGDYVLMVGDKKRWDVSVGPDGASTYAEYLTAGPDGDGALTASWNGRGEAQLFVAGPAPLDLAPLVAADGALVMLLSVSEPPDEPVELRIGCGYPCGASADVSKLLNALPAGQWLRVSFDLKCFVDQGLDVGNVDAPFLLLTDARMSLSIADVRFVPGMGETATIRCR